LTCCLVVASLSAMMKNLCIFLLVLVHADDDVDENGWKKTTNEKGERVQQMQVQAPTLTEQDQKDIRMPEAYRCDACMAITFHLKAKLDKHKTPLKSWDVVDLIEKTCVKDEFAGYGVKMHNGENALSGPGIIRDDSLSPGGASIQMGGETWQLRLASECKEMIFDVVGEEEMYGMYQNKGMDFQASVCKAADMCNAEGLQASKKDKKAKAKADKKKKDEKDDEKSTRREAKKAEKAERKAARKEERKAERKSGKDRKLNKSGMSFKQYQDALQARELLDDEGRQAFYGAKTELEWDTLIMKISNKINEENLKKNDL